MNLTTLARVKSLGEWSPADTEDDDDLDQLIEEWSKAAEVFMDRDAEILTYTQQFSLEQDQRTISLRAYGGATTLTEVKHSSTRDFVSAIAEPLTDFYLDPRTGMLAIDKFLSAGPGVLQVIWSGGMAATESAFATAFPDIAHAVEIQVVHIFQRRGELGVQAVSFAGQTYTAGGDGARWLDAATKLLIPNRRLGSIG